MTPLAGYKWHSLDAPRTPSRTAPLHLFPPPLLHHHHYPSAASRPPVTPSPRRSHPSIRPSFRGVPRLSDQVQFQQSFKEVVSFVPARVFFFFWLRQCCEKGGGGGGERGGWRVAKAERWIRRATDRPTERGRRWGGKGGKEKNKQTNIRARRQRAEKITRLLVEIRDKVVSKAQLTCWQRADPDRPPLLLFLLLHRRPSETGGGCSPGSALAARCATERAYQNGSMRRVRLGSARLDSAHLGYESDF